MVAGRLSRLWLRVEQNNFGPPGALFPSKRDQRLGDMLRLNELQSKLLVAPLVSPSMVPYIILPIIPLYGVQTIAHIGVIGIMEKKMETIIL